MSTSVPAVGVQPAGATLQLQRIYADNDPNKVPRLNNPADITFLRDNMQALRAYVTLVYTVGHDRVNGQPVAKLLAYSGGLGGDAVGSFVSLGPRKDLPGAATIGFNFQSLAHNGDYGHPQGPKEGYFVVYPYDAGGNAGAPLRIKIGYTQVPTPTWAAAMPWNSWKAGSWDMFITVPPTYYPHDLNVPYVTADYCVGWAIPAGGATGYRLAHGGGPPMALWQTCTTPAPTPSPGPGPIPNARLYAEILGGLAAALLLVGFVLPPRFAAFVRPSRFLAVLLGASAAALGVSTLLPAPKGADAA